MCILYILFGNPATDWTIAGAPLVLTLGCYIIAFHMTAFRYIYSTTVRRLDVFYGGGPHWLLLPLWLSLRGPEVWRPSLKANSSICISFDNGVSWTLGCFSLDHRSLVLPVVIRISSMGIPARKFCVRNTNVSNNCLMWFALSITNHSLPIPAPPLSWCSY